MFHFRKPSPQAVADWIETQSVLPFTYEPVGMTAQEPPPGYRVDNTRVRLGAGEAVFQAAKQALRRRDQFCLGWVELRGEPSWQTVAVVARALGIWSLNACRLAYLIDEPDLYAYAYGTLPDHVARGEERFSVSWDRETNEVRYEIRAFSRPRHPLAWLGYPYVRWKQREFRRDSPEAMLRAVRHFLAG